MKRVVVVSCRSLRCTFVTEGGEGANKTFPERFLSYNIMIEGNGSGLGGKGIERLTGSFHPVVDYDIRLTLKRRRPIDTAGGYARAVKLSKEPLCRVATP